MAVEVALPIVTTEGEDAVVTAWMVDEGSRVKKGQLIAEVQAEKVSMDVEAPIDGVVTNLVGINDPVPQGQPICQISEATERVDTPLPTPPQTSSPAPITPSSPAARRLARELGVELVDITGSGPGGRVTEADVRKSADSVDPVYDITLTGLRSVIARNMREANSTTAAVTLHSAADVTDKVPRQITAWVVRAVAIALDDHPDLNGVRNGDVFTPATTTRISLAIQTDAGLVAPGIDDPASKDLDSLMEEIANLAERARNRQLTHADFEGGTFSVTNLGGYGIDRFTPLINLPQIAILGVGAIRTVAGFSDGNVIPRRHMGLSLTFDHAFVDGAPAAEFLARVREVLEAGQ